MVWKQRLQPAPRRRYSARDIANILATEVDEVMAALAAIGEHVDSPAKRMIEEPVRRAIYEHMDVPYEPPGVAPVSSWERRGSVAKGRSAQGRRPSMLRDPERHEAIVRPKDQSVGLGDPDADVAPAWEDASWEWYGFTTAERDAWLTVLRRGQASNAAKYRDAGLAPEDLLVVVGGWPVFKRLRAGESLAYVKRLLERGRHAG